MAKRRNFIERDVFEEVMRHVRRTDGGKYEDVDTIYGDMSRLVVGWLAEAKTEDLRSVYNQVGWGGSANARAMVEAAKAWMKEYRNERDRLINSIRSFGESGKAVRVSFSNGSVYELKIVSTMHSEDGDDVVAEVLRTVKGESWKLDGAMNFYLGDVVAAEEVD